MLRCVRSIDFLKDNLGTHPLVGNGSDDAGPVFNVNILIGVDFDLVQTVGRCSQIAINACLRYAVKNEAGRAVCRLDDFLFQPVLTADCESRFGCSAVCSREDGDLVAGSFLQRRIADNVVRRLGVAGVKDHLHFPILAEQGVGNNALLDRHGNHFGVDDVEPGGNGFVIHEQHVNVCSAGGSLDRTVFGQTGYRHIQAAGDNHIVDHGAQIVTRLIASVS